MEECIAELNQKLRLTEKESTDLIISKGATEAAVKNGDLCLVGKLFANRFFGGEAVYEAMRKAWMTSGDIGSKSVGGNIFFFQFSNRVDMLRARNGGLWHVDQNLLALERFDGRLSPAEYKFKYVKVWLHVLDPPLMLMTLECAKQIGNQVGKFL